MIPNRTPYTREAAEAALLVNTRDLPRRARALEPGEHLLFADAPGLRLSRTTARAWSWVYRYRSPVDGRMRQLKLGRWPALAYAEALTRWNTLTQMRADGTDPTQARRESRQAALQAARSRAAARKQDAVTVERVCRLFLAEHVERECRTEKAKYEARRMFESRVLPEIGDKAAASITRPTRPTSSRTSKLDAPALARLFARGSAARGRTRSTASSCRPST